MLPVVHWITRSGALMYLPGSLGSVGEQTQKYPKCGWT
jgi:hypothetical protein